MSPRAAQDAPAEAAAVVDLLIDEMALARSQIGSGLASLAEGTVRRRLARLEADGETAGAEESDALWLLLAEALWRQQRPAAARAALDRMSAGSGQRRLPMAMLIDAETLASAGELDRAAGAQERLLAAVGADAVDGMRAGVPGRLEWPLPAELLPEAAPPARPPWGAPPPPAAESSSADDRRVIGARARMEEARVAYVAGKLDVGDAEMALAVRLDGDLAGDGVTIIEPTLGRQPSAERLILYGDLLRGAGRDAEAQRAYDRAARRRS